MKKLLFSKFIRGILIGLIPAVLYIFIREQTPAISCVGRVQVDSFSHSPDSPWIDAGGIFIENREAPNERLYLEFKNNKLLNDAIATQKKVMLTGKLEYVTLNSGELIAQLRVNNIDQVDTSLETKSLTATQDFSCLDIEKHRKFQNQKNKFSEHSF